MSTTPHPDTPLESAQREELPSPSQGEQHGVGGQHGGVSSVNGSADSFEPSIAGTADGVIPRPPDAPIVFAHPSERELARIFDFYRVPWTYEPRSFVLKAKGERILEMFSPDFYLPELDLYLELTTLRQRLVTKKNRKLRLLKELYPDVNVRLLYRRDYQELIAKYGYGPDEVESAEAEAFRAEAGADRILFSQSEIAAAVNRLGAHITEAYAGRPPVMVGVLKGVTFFLADLIRQIELPVEIDFMAVSTLGKGGAVRIVKDLDLDITGRHVILVEDIVDTGMTLRYLLGHLERWRPASLEVCALFDKRTRRLADVPIEYVGFELADEFIVGYGLDYHQRYRNLPFVASLRPERYRPADPSGQEAAVGAMRSVD
ncbi:MAG: hypoxanthine phosphoribosyltransferase [Chloroflexota bacterium]